MGKSLQLGFLGSGRMARAMVTGLIENGVTRPENITCTSAADGTGEQLAADLGIHFETDAGTALGSADWIVLACKPQQLDSLSAGAIEASRSRWIISILAGTPIRKLKTFFPHAAGIVRAMPNTPGQIRAGVTAWSCHENLTTEEKATVESILGALGPVHGLPEEQLDAVTGLSGSGPAYVFEMVAGLRDAGIAEGLDPEISYQLALQTVRGASELLVRVPEKPETHRDWVSSPGGTTLAGLAVLEKGNFRQLLKETVSAATRRSKELGG